MRRSVEHAALLTLLVVLVTQLACYAVWGDMAGGYDPTIVVAGALIPAVTCFPISLSLLLQRKQLAETLSRLENAHRLLHERSSCDDLTGLFHRRAFFERLTQVGKERGVFLMIDVDHFKSINDTRGHAAGDEALILIASVLRNAARDADIVARFGGEEFCIFSSPATLRDGERLAEQIRQMIGDLDFAPGGLPHRLSVSIGVADGGAFPSADASIRAADGALYLAKGRGRNRVVIARAPSALNEACSIGQLHPRPTMTS